MKYWILNNTKFGYKNNSKEWSKNMFDYFDNEFIPFLEKHAKPSDKLIHLGNIFNTSESVNTSTLVKVFNLFNKISSIVEVILVNGYNEKTGISQIFNNTNQIGEPLITNITDVDTYHQIKIIPNKNPLEYVSDSDSIVFINNRIDADILKNFKNTLFFCGYHDDRKVYPNVINVGAPYQLDKTSPDKGFYVLDPKSKKFKFIKNSYSPKFDTITITNISQINELDKDYINNNYVNVVVDKSLVEDKQVKVDILLSKYEFKSITYTNDVEEVVLDNDTLNMEELIRDKIKNSDNPELMSEFENIMGIYKEKY